MSNSTYIIPTKNNPIFVAQCDYFGYIEDSPWKEFKIDLPDGSETTGKTFALSFTNAIVDLHTWITEYPQILDEYPKATFSIHLVNGKVDEYGQYATPMVYKISASKAKKLLIQ